ncbi:MAG: M17 family peptidase N-terminal domain-containing protein, partial [Pyrinomonadaceae bacterium]
MEFQGISSNFVEAGTEALAIVVFKGEKGTSSSLKDLDKLSNGHLSAAIKSEEFKGEVGDTALIRLSPKGKMKSSGLLLVGAGEKKEYKAAGVSIAAGTATRYLRKCNFKSFAFMPRFDGSEVEASQNSVQGAITSQFELDKYKTKDKNTKAVTKLVVCVDGAKPAGLKSGIARGEAIGESMNFTRDLANEPPNILTPTEMANRAAKVAKEVGLKYEVLD